nr:reverse transcriptase domain-containing protein [Tanacetum cinerariifolium]
MIHLFPLGRAHFDEGSLVGKDDRRPGPHLWQSCLHRCLSHLEKMLKWCEDTNLCLNWEKSHFMVKEGIVLGHKISKDEIKVDKAKADVIAKLPYPTTVNGICSFLGHAASIDDS